MLPRPPTLPFALAALAIACGACTAARTPPLPQPPALADAARVHAELTSTIRFLADDALEGRGPGTRGDHLTQMFIATRMEALGLRPAAPDGSWLQPFELIGITSSTPERWRFRAGAVQLDLERGSDFVAGSTHAVPRVGIDGAELVFVGYGIQAPEYDWDDFKGADLEGKVLVMLNNDPDWDDELFAGKRRLYYGRWTYKYESAARQRAAGAIVVHTDDSAGYPWQTVRTSWSGENSRLPGRDGERPPVQAWATAAAIERIAAMGGHDWAALVEAARGRDFAPVPLRVTTALEVENALRPYQTANVAGILPGSDPVLAEEAVVYTAHHDHLGMAEEGEDRIYNGALDNAVGVAKMLAIAGAFTSLPEPPRRSVLFVAVAAEEQGLLGSEYFAAHPPIPPARMAANLNMDGGNIWGRTGSVAAVGYGKSSLDDVVRAAAARQGRAYVDESFPEQGSFYRSDQFNFARVGVPALFLRAGMDFVGRPPEWGREQVQGWIARHYHQPSDELDASWDLGGMVEDVSLLFEVGYEVAEVEERPRWVVGDEFEAVRLMSLGEKQR